MTAQLGEGKDRGGLKMERPEEQVNFNQMPPMPDNPDEAWWASVLADEPMIKAGSQGLIHTTTNPHVIKDSTDDLVSVNWGKVADLFTNDEIVTLQVVSFNRGGILVEGEDIQGFVPASHLIDIPTNIAENEREPYLTSYVDRKISLKVIEYEPEKERIVFSERAALAGPGQRKVLLNSLSVGDIVSGYVTNVTSFGVFVDLGGLEGLIHVSELSWGRVHHPASILKIGDEVNTMVLEILEDQGRIALSLKRLEDNPWEVISQQLSPGDVVDAVITSIVKYGAFARLDEGVEGLIHISSINIPADCTRIDDFLFEGQPVKVGIISIDSEKRRLGLKLESAE